MALPLPAPIVSVAAHNPLQLYQLHRLGNRYRLLGEHHHYHDIREAETDSPGLPVRPSGAAKCGGVMYLRDELEKLRLPHLVVDGDCWFSCPKSGECCNEESKDVCTCGADEHNAMLDRILVANP